jgi:hypothetical protein
MNQLFRGQTYVELVLDTGNDLTGTTNHKILAKKQDGSKVEWSATPVGTTIKYEVQPTDLDQVGKLEIQAYYEVSGRKAFGKVVVVQILDNLKS